MFYYFSNLYLGHGSGKGGWEFVSHIVKERVAAILGSSVFMSILIDRSQVQKAGSDK